ncbi:MAG: porin [bacterium]|nr:porin [bacterium]
MRFKVLVLTAALAAVVLGPPVAQADEAATARLQALQERLLALEDRIDERQEAIAVNRDLLDRHVESAPDVSQGSGLDGFFSGLEVGGHIAASYVWAGENPSKGTKGTGSPAPTTTQPMCQFNCNHNTFSLDAVKLEIGKPTNGSGTAGFQLDLLFGQNAAILDTGTASLSGYTTSPGGSDTDLFIQEAYLMYNHNGVDFLFGKFETLLGYEVLDSVENPNISHGLLYTWAIPLLHTGVLASGQFNENLGWAAGVTNGFNNALDLNENKGILAQLRYGGGPLSASLQTYYGADMARQPPSFGPASTVNTTSERQTDDALIVDLVATYKASDSLNFWLQADWGEQEDVAGFVATDYDDRIWYGAEVGTQIQLNDKLSLALRGEYFFDEKGTRTLKQTEKFPATEDAVFYSLTGTLSYAMTPNLTTRAEVRFDRADWSTGTDKIFPSGTTTPSVSDNEEDAVTGYLEVSYSFD